MRKKIPAPILYFHDTLKNPKLDTVDESLKCRGFLKVERGDNMIANLIADITVLPKPQEGLEL